MKLKTSTKIHYDSGPNLTPMVDVVMVILIFLMLAGSFGLIDAYRVSNLPFKQAGTSAGKVPPGFIPEEPLNIRIDSPSPDRWIAQIGDYRAMDLKSLTEKLERMRSELGDDAQRVQVLISPAANVRYEHLFSIYQAVADAQFKKVSFTTSH